LGTIFRKINWMHVVLLLVLLLVNTCSAFTSLPRTSAFRFPFHTRLRFAATAANTEPEFFFDPEASYVGIDYGLKVCGVAAIQMDVADAFRPLANTGNLTKLSLDILREAARAKPSAYIIGWPLDWDGGSTNLQAQRCLNFARVFAGVVEKTHGPGIPTFLFDERYTTSLGTAQFKSKRGACNAQAAHPTTGLQSQLSRCCWWLAVAGALDGNAAYHIVDRWIAEQGEGSAFVTPVLNPSRELELINPREEEWQTPREVNTFQRPQDTFIGKRKVIRAAQPLRLPEPKTTR
jgi:RNase H-fold protein (predicted Holliday junction resolvase)